MINVINAASSVGSDFTTAAMQGVITYVYFDLCTYMHIHTDTHKINNRHTLTKTPCLFLDLSLSFSPCISLSSIVTSMLMMP